MTTLFITGASAGIGLATAGRFLDAGSTVVNLSRRQCPLSDVHSIQLDLSSSTLEQELQASLSALNLACGKFTLVHNASRLLNDSATATSDETLMDVVQVNLLAVNTLNRLLLPHMQTGSSVIFVGSTLSEKAVPNSFSYVTTKHAQVGMMRALCQDLAGTGIHTACICPGFTDTEMLREHVPADQMENVAAMSAYNRLITPEEIAEVAFAVANNPVLNGSIIHANLGQIES